MSIQEVVPEQLAKLFHHYHRALAPDAGSQAGSSEAWEEVPQQERTRLVEAARLALLELRADRSGARRYFAQPGSAEWGC